MSETPQASPVFTGTLARWLADRGYGFIESDVPGPAIFVHKTDMLEPIPTKCRIEFELTKFGGRIKAVRVRLEGSDVR